MSGGRARPSVVMVSASFHPHVGGAEKQALELSAALRARGTEVRVLTRRLPGLPAREELRGVAVERLWCAGGGVLNALTFMLSLGAWLWRRRAGYDAVHAHLAGSPALAAAAVGRALGKRVLIKLGGGRGIGELAASAASLAGRLKLAAFARLKPQFVCVTGELAEECARYLGAVPVRVQPNGVDIARYRPAALEEKLRLRRELGWPAGLGFLYVGRLSWEKRLDWFLSRWLARAAEGGEFIAFVGAGPELAKLRSGAGGELGRRVFILPPMPEIERAYAAADVFVLPSVSEGLSNALLEAMASGLAVLASRVGGTAEAVEDGRQGLLFAADRAAELDRALGRLRAEPELAPRLGAEARRKAEAEFSIEKTAQAYERLYR
ncbi:MAG: glycosyltransferase family 4 protein [Elusimicrobia bacterium]|nr:glycosyltransferase family 4 protein [Elusimicrobiota bacterium]